MPCKVEKCVITNESTCCMECDKQKGCNQVCLTSTEVRKYTDCVEWGSE